MRPEGWEHENCVFGEHIYSIYILLVLYWREQAYLLNKHNYLKGIPVSPKLSISPRVCHSTGMNINGTCSVNLSKPFLQLRISAQTTDIYLLYACRIANRKGHAARHHERGLCTEKDPPPSRPVLGDPQATRGKATNIGWKDCTRATSSNSYDRVTMTLVSGFIPVTKHMWICTCAYTGPSLLHSNKVHACYSKVCLCARASRHTTASILAC